MQRYFWVLVALIIGLAPKGAVYADSDGYYCSETNLLAYELSFSGSAQGHWLHIIRFGPIAGISGPVSVELPPFQVNGMQCSPGRVEILGWRNLYVFEVTNWKEPVLVEKRTLLKPGARPEGFKARSDNLGAWFKDRKTGHGFGRVDLQSTDSKHKYALDVPLTPMPARSCTSSVKTRLLQLDDSDAITADVIILETYRDGECG